MLPGLNMTLSEGEGVRRDGEGKKKRERRDEEAKKFGKFLEETQSVTRCEQRSQSQSEYI